VSKKTVIIGATPNPSRYAYLAAEMLTDYHHEIVPVGIKQGMVQGVPILPIQTKPVVPHVDTITMYIGPQHQPEWYDYLLSLKPKLIIFKPATENDELTRLAAAKGIETLEACTLVMLRSGQY